MRLAALIDDAAQMVVDDRVEDDAGLFLDVLEYLDQLLFGTDQRIDVLDGARILVLRRSGPAGGEESLAGRVRNQMQMEEVLRLVHAFLHGLWSNVDKAGRENGSAGRHCIRSHLVHNSTAVERQTAGLWMETWTSYLS